VIRRRTLLTAGPMMLAACSRAEEAYFGRTDPPRSQRLVYLLGAEPGTLDPAKSGDLWEAPVIHALFEGLVTCIAATGEPAAALATHCAISADGLRYTFCLRGHPDPGGTVLSGGGVTAAPARWSDGKIITARDFVYSWRRAIDPATGNPYAYSFHQIGNGESISNGTMAPHQLAVHAADDFTFVVRLELPAPFFLRLIADRQFFAVPRQAIEQAQRQGAEELWTQPEKIVVSGAFRLRERRAHDRIVLGRNPLYYAGGQVSLQEIVFIPVVDGSTSANLYRSGEAAFSMPMIPQVLAKLRKKKDVRAYPNFGAHFNVFNTKKPPFHDPRLRYAFNMATDKRAIAAFFDDGRTHLTGLIPPLKNYPSAARLPVATGGESFDVLSYNPQAGRRLLAMAGHSRGLSVEYLYPSMAEFGLVAEILQQQWRANLGVEVRLVCQDVRSWAENTFKVTYKDIAAYGEVFALEDPTSLLNMFGTASNASGTGWSDSQFDAQLGQARTLRDPSARLRKLSECEQLLLRAMPIAPLYSDVSVFLCKPFVKGLVGDPFHGRMFNDIWIDTKWRPS
jgi:oligopeptide transport system substrate-binding protein